jgi:hypothetical protein
MLSLNLQFIRKKNPAAILLALAFFSFVGGCRRTDNPVETNEQESITTMRLTLTPVGGGAPITAQWRDLDGAGGNPPVITPLALRAGTTYNGTVEVLDESKTPAENKTEEILEEANEHLFVYTVSGGAQGRVNITVTDLDTNTPPLPVGLQYRVVVTAGAAASGNLRVILYHYDGVRKTVNPSNEIDIDASFPLNVTP